MGSYRLTWQPLAGGHLALGHRPGKRLRERLEETGCTLVVNLLSDFESSASVHEGRVRLPMVSATPPKDERDAEVLALLEHIEAALSDGGKVFIHCSAGLHRTGMIAYALLRHLGHTPDEAVEAIREMRELTAKELRKARREWGERFAK